MMKGVSMPMFRLYAAWLRLALISQAQYRAALILYLLQRLIEPVIYLTVWTTIAAQSGEGVDGYSGGDLAAYFLAVLIANHITFGWHAPWYDYLIRTGAFSALLLRPVHPIHADLADNIASKLLTLPVMLVLVGFMSAAYSVEIPPARWIVFAFSLIPAFILRFTLEYSIGLLAFWTTRLSAIIQFYGAVSLFLSGRMAPLDFLPGPLQGVAAWLPFYGMIGLPVDMFMGRLSPGETVAGWFTQGTWIALTGAGAVLLWRMGIRRYTAAGG
jgi:ABC-2 type transport system permease protein